MNGKENPAELLVMCVVMIVLSVAGVIGAFSRGLFGSLDGLLILFVSLLMLLIFGLLLFFQLKQQGTNKHQNDEGPAGSPAAGK